MVKTVKDASEFPAWFKVRRYPHFDNQLGYSDIAWIATDKARVARHAFMPFISRMKNDRRYAKQPDGTRKIKPKERRIAYASHADAHIFSFYSHLLARAYESAITSTGASPSVLAYRRFDLPKSNIHFASEAFEYIRLNSPCSVVAIDIEKFFDTIPHQIIKARWKELVSANSELPEDHYAVYRAVTKWRHVDFKRIMAALGISRGAYRKLRPGQRLCSPSRFRANIAPLLERGFTPGESGSGAGIPQGSPMSGLLSNIALLDFDRVVSKQAEQNNVLYRRYSDDVLLIGSESDVANVERALLSEVSGHGLVVNDEKTIRTSFRQLGDGSCVAEPHSLQYLGFLFTGSQTLIRSQTVGRSARRMKRDVRRAAKAAKKHSSGPIKIWRKTLYEQHSHLGPKKRKEGRRKNSNFWTYAKNAERTHAAPEIRRQLRNHWRRLHQEISRAEAEEE